MIAMAQDWRTRVGLILRHFGFRGVDGFVLFWRHVIQGLVDALAIIKHFDVLEHTGPSSGQVGVGMMVRPLLF